MFVLCEGEVSTTLPLLLSPGADASYTRCRYGEDCDFSHDPCKVGRPIMNTLGTGTGLSRRFFVLAGSCTSLFSLLDSICPFCRVLFIRSLARWQHSLGSFAWVRTCNNTEVSIKRSRDLPLSRTLRVKKDFMYHNRLSIINHDEIPFFICAL
jgi:hypothetical protein